MIEKRTVISQIEVTDSGTLQIRFRKEIVEDGEVLAFEYHRTSVECGGDVDAQLAAVNTHLAALNSAPVSAADIVRIKNIALVDWTPERVAKWNAAKGTKGKNVV